MTMGYTPFCAHLVEGWRRRIFKDRIFPGFPFRSSEWVAMAFNRDTQGLRRMPVAVWSSALGAMRHIERFGFIVSPDPVVSGSVSQLEQPFVVALELESVLNHFDNSEMYLPEFFMSSASESWGIWGDSDFTVLGGHVAMMEYVFECFGGATGAMQQMVDDFHLDPRSAVDASMLEYCQQLLVGD